MARPRNSLAKARLTGAIAKDPQRYRNRVEPKVDEPLGKPPAWLTKVQASIWKDLDKRLPWLDQSHRCIVGIAALLQSQLMSGTIGVPGMQLLRQVLGQLGATPVSAGKINWTPQIDDPDDELFER